MPAPPPGRWFADGRVFVLLALAGVSLIAWLQLAGMARQMDDPATVWGAAMMRGAGAWSVADTALTCAMWAVMMVGMMLPSAAPMVLFYASFLRRNRIAATPSLFLFLGGYLVVWTAFSCAATALQWMLQRLGQLDPMLASRSAWLGATLLLAAGAYQLSPLKAACLRWCGSPVTFVMRRWRRGLAGALRMGLEHGLLCLGCCWALMLLLFVGGVMNLLWVALLSAFVLVEKLAPRSRALHYGSAVGLLMAGVAFLWAG